MKIIDRLLDVLEQDILPLTEAAVGAGNKIFGAAVLDKQSLDLVIAGTNEETHNPLFHGEIACLNRFWALPSNQRPAPSECIFLSTHEPCSMCLSAITWSGFDNFYYLFSYEDSKDAFDIPHDLKILEQVFAVKDGAYLAENEYWRSFSLTALIEQDRDPQQTARLQRIASLRTAYATVSAIYQSSKSDSEIPLP